MVAQAALEVLARAVHLAEPALEIEKRIVRYETEVLYSQREVLELYETGSAGARKAQKRINAVLSTVKDLGLTSTPSPNKKRQRGNTKHKAQSLPLEDRPAATTLVKRLMLDAKDNNLGELAYRLTSASAHGTYYALVRFIVRDDPTLLSGGSAPIAIR